MLWRIVTSTPSIMPMEELVTLDYLFIDGTKIEANANKYSFVWKNPTMKVKFELLRGE